MRKLVLALCSFFVAQSVAFAGPRPHDDKQDHHRPKHVLAHQTHKHDEHRRPKAHQAANANHNRPYFTKKKPNQSHASHRPHWNRKVAWDNRH